MTSEKKTVPFRKIPISFFESPAYQNAKCCLVYLEIFRRVSNCDGWRTLTNGDTIFLKFGECFFGVDELSKKRGLTSQNTRTCLKKLKTWENLTYKTTNKGTLATLCDYADYNEPYDPTNKPINKQLTNDQQTTNKQLTTTIRYINIKDLLEERGEGNYTPTNQQIFEYAKEINCPEPVAKKCKEYYQSSSGVWRDKDGYIIIEWRKKLQTWRNREPAKPNQKGSPEIITQEDYDNEF